MQAVEAERDALLAELVEVKESAAYHFDCADTEIEFLRNSLAEKDEELKALDELVAALEANWSLTRIRNAHARLAEVRGGRETP